MVAILIVLFLLLVGVVRKLRILDKQNAMRDDILGSMITIQTALEKRIHELEHPRALQTVTYTIKDFNS